MAKFHVRRGDKVLGPFPPDKIKQMIADDKIKPYDLIRGEGGDQWNTIGDVPNLAKCFRAKRTRGLAMGLFQGVGITLGGTIGVACVIFCLGVGMRTGPTPSRKLFDDYELQRAMSNELIREGANPSDAREFSRELIKLEREWENTPASQKRKYSRP